MLPERLFRSFITGFLILGASADSIQEETEDTRSVKERLQDHFDTFRQVLESQPQAEIEGLENEIKARPSFSSKDAGDISSPGEYSILPIVPTRSYPTTFFKSLPKVTEVESRTSQETGGWGVKSTTVTGASVEQPYNTLQPVPSANVITKTVTQFITPTPIKHAPTTIQHSPEFDYRELERLLRQALDYTVKSETKETARVSKATIPNTEPTIIPEPSTTEISTGYSITGPSTVVTSSPTSIPKIPTAGKVKNLLNQKNPSYELSVSPQFQYHHPVAQEVSVVPYSKPKIDWIALGAKMRQGAREKAVTKAAEESNQEEGQILVEEPEVEEELAIESPDRSHASKQEKLVSDLSNINSEVDLSGLKEIYLQLKKLIESEEEQTDLLTIQGQEMEPEESEISSSVNVEDALKSAYDFAIEEKEIGEEIKGEEQTTVNEAAESSNKEDGNLEPEISGTTPKTTENSPFKTFPSTNQIHDSYLKHQKEQEQQKKPKSYEYSFDWDRPRSRLHTRNATRYGPHAIPHRDSATKHMIPRSLTVLVPALVSVALFCS